MKPVKLTEPAIQDLEEIYDYIALDNVDAAERLKDRLQKRWRAAAENPGTGRMRSELQSNLRSVRCKSRNCLSVILVIKWHYFTEINGSVY